MFKRPEVTVLPGDTVRLLVNVVTVDTSEVRWTTLWAEINNDFFTIALGIERAPFFISLAITGGRAFLGVESRNLGKLGVNWTDSSAAVGVIGVTVGAEEFDSWPLRLFGLLLGCDHGHKQGSEN